MRNRLVRYTILCRKWFRARLRFRLRIVFDINGFALALGIVVDDEFERFGDNHCTLRAVVQILSNAMFQNGNIHFAVRFCHADTRAEIADCFWCVTSLSYARKRGKTRIVPAPNHFFVDKTFDETFAHDSVREVEPCKLDLSGTRIESAIERNPVVKRTMVFKFKRAKRVRDALDCVLDGMCKSYMGYITH